ncbi:MAG: DUF3726 domain-containing protein [Candidatus Puniceispirillales bacterium]
MIAVSQNEIAATTVKACRGVGVEWGLAHDAGHLAQHLAACGEPFLGSLLKVLETIDGDDQPCLTDAAATRMIHAPVAGLALIEWIAATGEAWQGQITAPRYLLAALVVFTAETQTVFVVETAAGSRLTAAGGQVKGSGVLKPDDMITISTSEVAPGAGENRLAPAQPGVAVDVPSSCWQRLMEYAHRTYVPESDRSRAAGAGAGDIDNE